MKSIKKVPFSQLKEEIMEEQADILIDIAFAEKRDMSADIKNLKKSFKKAKNLEDLVNVMSDYGYWDSEAYQIIIKKLVDPKK